MCVCVCVCVCVCPECNPSQVEDSKQKNPPVKHSKMLIMTSFTKPKPNISQPGSRGHMAVKLYLIENWYESLQDLHLAKKKKTQVSCVSFCIVFLHNFSIIQHEKLLCFMIYWEKSAFWGHRFTFYSQINTPNGAHLTWKLLDGRQWHLCKSASRRDTWDDLVKFQLWLVCFFLILTSTSNRTQPTQPVPQHLITNFLTNNDFTRPS